MNLNQKVNTGVTTGVLLGAAFLAIILYFLNQSIENEVSGYYSAAIANPSTDYAELLE